MKGGSPRTPVGADIDPYSYEGFRRAAVDESRSVYEKIGFPDAYRAGKEMEILADIRSKATNLDTAGCSVVDIGSGCSPLALTLIDHARLHRHRLTMIDSPEMLDHLPSEPSVTRLPGRFPSDHREFVLEQAGRFDVVLVYSVFQYIVAESNAIDFLDGAVTLLAPGGQLLVGDLPNESMRSRFLDSADGRAFADAARTPRPGESGGLRLAPGKLDDGLLIGLLIRYRAAGYHGYVVPQSSALPMSNRREDLLIVRP